VYTGLGSHVCSNIDLVRKLVDGNFEARLDFFENSRVFLGRNESDCQTLGSETTRTANSVQVSVVVSGHIVVDDDIDTFEVNTTAKDVGRHKKSAISFFKLIVSFDSLCLLEVSHHSHGREVALLEQLVELPASADSIDEDDDLVEFQSIEKVGELPILLPFLQLDVVLLKTTESELLLIVN